jgi:release factor glutamine methyltransferase
MLAAARSVADALRAARAWLVAETRGERPELEAQVLLAHVTGWSRTALIAYPERALTPGQAATYAALVARRATGEPVAYLTGHRAFLGLDFKTDPRALIPRPETHGQRRDRGEHRRAGTAAAACLRDRHLGGGHCAGEREC